MFLALTGLCVSFILNLNATIAIIKAIPVETYIKKIIPFTKLASIYNNKLKYI